MKKRVKIISIREVDKFISYFQSNVLDSKKTNLLVNMKIDKAYFANKARGCDYFSRITSDRIIKYAKNYGYEFK